MEGSREVRASDTDREAAAERLRTALQEGCLDFTEFDQRLGRAYESVTRGELAKLVDDLPVPAQAENQDKTAGIASVATMPRWLKIAWGIWGGLFAFNVVAWTVVSIVTADIDDFWPKGFGPPGVILGIITLVDFMRRRTGSQADGG